jgi:hypothetical protein
MYGLVLLLDLLVLCTVAGSAWLWWAASRRRVRRMRRDEVLDAADINRIVVAMNRAQILNSRAALATGCAAVLATLRLCLDAVGVDAF